MTVRIVRDEVPFPSVRNAFMLRPGIGYIGLTGGFALQIISGLWLMAIDLNVDAATLMANSLVQGIAIGYDFHFGKGRGGSPAMLVGEAPALGIEVDVQPHVDFGDHPVSSSAIRKALEAGDIAAATDMLSGPWFVTGEVIHGDKRGRDLGYPTANIRLDPQCSLRHGIYAVRVGRGGKLLDGVANFGRRPTVTDTCAPLLEVFVFDFSGDLYGKVAEVSFIGWIRGEAKFSGLDELVVAMNRDKELAREILTAAR